MSHMRTHIVQVLNMYLSRCITTKTLHQFYWSGRKVFSVLFRSDPRIRKDSKKQTQLHL